MNPHKTHHTSSCMEEMQEFPEIALSSPILLTQVDLEDYQTQHGLTEA